MISVDCCFGGAWVAVLWFLALIVLLSFGVFVSVRRWLGAAESATQPSVKAADDVVAVAAASMRSVLVQSGQGLSKL